MKNRAIEELNGNFEGVKLAKKNQEYFRLEWKDLQTLQTKTALPIILKGVLSKDDVIKASKLGFKGVVISNHGGRQLDYAPPPIEVLAEVNRATKTEKLNDGFEIYIDGGIRRGSDIVKCLCLGAKGVGLGRPFLYSMAGYGEEGVTKCIQILKEETLRDMQLIGVRSIDQLNDSYLDLSRLKY